MEPATERLVLATITQVRKNSSLILFLGGLAVFAYVAYIAFSFFAWLLTESPQQRAHREEVARYQAWKTNLSQHVDMCAKKNGKDHFPPMLGFSPLGSGGCGDFGRFNGVACTANGTFQDDLKVMWDQVRTRNACVVWKPSRVTWRGAEQVYGGVTAYPDDGVGKSISIAFKEKKLKLKQ
jgi:hypothetical protein